MKTIFLFFLILFSAACNATEVLSSGNEAKREADEIRKTKQRITILEKKERQLLDKLMESGLSSTDIESATSHKRYITPTTIISGEEADKYREEIKLRIESCGTENFPKRRGIKLYGNGVYSFTIDKQGILSHQQVERSSGVKELDRHVARIIAASEPFGEVPFAIHEDRYTEFVFITLFKFVREDLSDKIPPSLPKQHCKLTSTR